MSDILYRKQKKYYFLLVLPALCIYTFALAGPLIFGTIPNSFFSWNLIKGTHNWIGIKNFVDLVHDRDFIQSMFLTFKLAVVTIVLNNVLAFFIALALNTHIFGKPVIRAFFFIPNIISGVMIALAWTFIFQKVTPIIGELLHSEAVTGFSWFGSSTAAFAAVSVVTVWQGLGFLMILYITGLQSIPLDVMEAACIDGCVGLNRIIKIQLPLLMPTITINLFVSIANAFKAFDINYALTGGGPSKTTQTIAMNIYDDAFGTFNMGYGCAKSVILFLIIAAISLIQLNITRKREVQS